MRADDPDDYFPAAFHVYEKDILQHALTKIGFPIASADYLDGKLHGAVQDTWLDGREYLGITAVKP